MIKEELTKERYLANVKAFRDMHNSIKGMSVTEANAQIEGFRSSVMDIAVKNAIEEDMSTITSLENPFGASFDGISIGEFTNNLDMLENAIGMHLRVKNKDMTVEDLSVQTNSDEEAAKYYDEEIKEQIGSHDVESPNKDA